MAYLAGGPELNLTGTVRIARENDISEDTVFVKIARYESARCLPSCRLKNFLKRNACKPSFGSGLASQTCAIAIALKIKFEDTVSVQKRHMHGVDPIAALKMFINMFY